MKYSELRFSWIPTAGFILAALGFPLTAMGAIKKETYLYIFSIGVATIVIGNLLIVFLAKEEHREYLGLPAKTLVVGFAFFVLSLAFTAADIAPALKDILLYGSVSLAILGIVGLSRS